jgi:ABC-type glycerol-3-phosphate transport system substrate-binding protein
MDEPTGTRWCGGHGRARAMVTRRDVGRAGAALAGGLPVAGWLAACGRAPAPAAAPAAAPASIEWSFAVDPGFDTPMLENVRLFQLAHPQVTVQARDESGLGGTGQTQKVLTQLAAGTPPDATYFTAKQFTAYVAIDALLELDTRLAKDRAVNLADVYPTTIEYSRFDPQRRVHGLGQVFGLPYLFGPVFMAYNKSLFQRRGVKLPDDFEQAGQWTWDAVLDVCRQLTAGGGDERTWGFAPPFPTGIDISNAWMWPMGAQFFDRELKQSLLTSPESVAAHQYMADLFTRHKVAPAPAEAPPGGIASGRVGLAMLLRQTATTFDRADFEKGMVPAPKGKGGRVVRAAPHAGGVLKATKQPDAAYELVKFFTLPEAQRTWTGTFPGTVPVRRTMAEGADFVKGLRPWENAAVYRESNRLLRVTQLPARSPDMDTLLTDAQKAMQLGEQPAEAALGTIKPQWDGLFQAR